MPASCAWKARSTSSRKAMSCTSASTSKWGHSWFASKRGRACLRVWRGVTFCEFAGARDDHFWREAAAQHRLHQAGFFQPNVHGCRLTDRGQRTYAQNLFRLADQASLELEIFILPSLNFANHRLQRGKLASGVLADHGEISVCRTVPVIRVFLEVCTQVQRGILRHTGTRQLFQELRFVQVLEDEQEGMI